MEPQRVKGSTPAIPPLAYISYGVHFLGARHQTPMVGFAETWVKLTLCKIKYANIDIAGSTPLCSL